MKRAHNMVIEYAVKDILRPLDEVIKGGRTIRLDSPDGPIWFVGSRPIKEGLVEQGVPEGYVWTIAELASLPWEGPLNLARVLLTFSGHYMEELQHHGAEP